MPMRNESALSLVLSVLNIFVIEMYINKSQSS